MEIYQDSGSPYQRRYEMFVSLAHRLTGLTETGRLSHKKAAYHLGRFLMEHGVIRTTPVAKNVLHQSEEVLTPNCREDCGRMPDCLTEHHDYWPKSDYQDPISFAFRELPANKHILCENVHRWIHADKRNTPPDKPLHREMVAAVLNSTIAMQPRLESEVESMIYSEPDNINNV